MSNILIRIITALLLTLLTTLNVYSAQPGTTPASNSRPSTVRPEPSALERFRTYSGARTPKALTALFAVAPDSNIRQQPEVALSDGATMVKITLAVGSQKSEAPNVAFEGAQLISLKRNIAGEWEIVALPEAGSLNPSLFLLTGSDLREIPLTVAPTLPAGTDLSERGFIAFLGGTTASARPLRDLNDDGRRDYLDDYIFAANYLVRPSNLTAPSDSARETIKLAPGVEPSSDPHNVNNRNQRAREWMRKKPPVSGTPDAAVPAAQ